MYLQDEQTGYRVGQAIDATDRGCREGEAQSVQEILLPGSSYPDNGHAGARRADDISQGIHSEGLRVCILPGYEFPSQPSSLRLLAMSTKMTFDGWKAFWHCTVSA